MAYQPIPGPSSGSSSSSGFQFLNSPFGDTTYTKVFVGGLAWETQSETMRRYFEQFGEILEAVVITDKNTGRSKGYGFVTFRDPESARRACADPAPIIDGRRANCNLASLGRPRPSMSYGRLRPVTPYLGSVPATRGSYVGNFGYQQPVSYSYQQGFMYPSYGNAKSGSCGGYVPQLNVCPWTDMQHMDLNMCIHRVFTILIQASNTFRYMGCLGQLIQLFIRMDNWVRLFPAVMVIQRYRVMQCQVISSCNLVGLVSMPYQHRLFQQFRHPILQV
ncbi:probable RNA-binding protein ARP1 isoform X2 [Vitis riparia]|uniref:probable RNA-binding protein ARP1 isoform X2 n=1 Tax=Vitis riparia TaxID=96939 RepID=UPI00155A6EA4|nr:probable RNA-binding protein ARP1 isoform X2 [Vitis riparia]